MKMIVVDASIAATWLIQDEPSLTGRWVLERVNSGVTMAVPSLWLLEMVNLLSTAERCRRISRLDREDALNALAALPFRILAPPSLSDLPVLDLLMREHRLTAYDAEYLRVCADQKSALASLDRALLAAARREGVVIAEPS